MDDKTLLLRAVSRSYLFNVFSEAEVERLLECASVEKFARGERVFAEGDPPDKFYLVLDGTIRVTQSIPHKTECSLAELGDGETIGEMSFLDRFPRSATAVAVGDTQLLAFDFAAFDELLSRDQDLALKWFWLFGRSLAQRLREANERIKELVQSLPSAAPLPTA
ncbi:MAG: cyclic nucleotide-binding domain-containing protein [Acidobacteriota bacterium]